MDATRFYDINFNSIPDGVHSLVRGQGRDVIRIAAWRDHLLIILEGEPDADMIVEGLKTGLAAGWLRLSMWTLVDLTNYMGVIDWGALKRLSEIAAWGRVSPEKSAVAYVVRNNEFGLIIKAISALFGRTRHRAFSMRADAVIWLMEKAPDPVRGPACDG
jgi:hypothetical protein